MRSTKLLGLTAQDMGREPQDEPGMGFGPMVCMASIAPLIWEEVASPEPPYAARCVWVVDAGLLA